MGAESAFEGLGNLQQLDLNYNQLSSVPDKAFEGLENLPPERSAHAAVALWEKCTPELSTDDGGVARYGGRALLASEGPCTSRITGKIG